MDNTMIFFILASIFTSLSFVTLTVVIVFLYRYLIKKIEANEKEIKNKKYELFESVDIEKINKAVDEYISGYVNRYVINKFIANNITYIKEQDQLNMIRDITKNIMLDISELYIHYISLIFSIETDEDLVRYINTKVKMESISFVADYNKARTDMNLVKIV